MKNILHNFPVLFFLMVSLHCFAQEKTVTGKVVDGTGEPLIGVTVSIEGTSKGTIADPDGNYSITVSSESDVLVFSFIGFKTQKITVGSQNQIDVKMEEDMVNLQEVIAIGYGTMKKSDLTGAVASVSTEDLKGLSISNADQMLKGRLAGVQVSQNSGAPGGATSIRIRGASSINNSNEPLYIIDGVPFNGQGTEIGGFDWSGGTNGQNIVNPLSTIAPSDIVSFNVLKDASATAIYGAAGANGVVIIETRRGKAGSTKISYDGYYSIQEIAQTIDMMNLRDYAQYQVEIGDFLQQEVNEAFKDPLILGEGTDWQDAIFRKAPIQSHQISLTAGTEKLKFAASAGYMDQDGIIFGSGFERYNARFNTDGEIRSWLKMGGSLALTHTDETITRQDGTDGVIMQALTMQPSVPVYDFEGNYAGPTTVNGASQYNPVWLAKMQNNTLARNRVMGNIYMSIDILKNLNLRSEFGYDIADNKNKSFIPTYDFGLISSDINQMYQREDHSLYWIWKEYATYKLQVEKHDISFMAGAEMSKNAWEGVQFIKQGFTTDDINVMNEDGDYVSNDGWKDEATSASTFGRLNYNYDNRYLLTATMRADGSSKFGSENKWGYFPSAALAWRASNEPFLQAIESLSNLKLRLGYGMTGNSNIGTYKYGSAMYTLSTPLGTAYRLANVSNPKLKWEASEQYNAGIDVGIIKNRFTLTVDVYQKSTKDLLMQVSIPSYLGDENDYDGIAAPYVNIGKTRNRGIEISFNSVNIAASDFLWSTNIVFSLNRNKVLALNDDSQVIYGKIDWWSEFQTATAIMVGQPIGVYYGYVVDRLFTDEGDILNAPIQYADPENENINYYNKSSGIYVGDIKFKDLNGDGIINDNDQKVIGDPNPDFTFGFNNTFEYKNIELTVGFTGSYGGDILNFSRYKIEGMTSIWDNQSKAVADRAQIGTDGSGNAYLLNPGATVPRPATNDFNRNTRMSDRWIEDGSYIRLSNIKLGYQLPDKFMNLAGLTDVKVFASIQNLYTWTKYSGYDPEIGAYNQNAVYQNIDRGRYPTPRTYTFGINVGF